MNEPSAVQSTARSWSWKRFFVRSSLICLALCVGAVAIGVWKIRSTLPRLDGTLRVVGIQHKVQIQRDNLGVPSILAQSREDAAYGLGFAHAQDRFFQMDLLRRIPSGRMGELFGQMGLRLDRSFRKHRFETTSQIVIEAIPENHRRVLDAYAEGVNAGLASLSSVPIEYMALGRTPRSWSPSDSILVMLAMMCDLQPMDAEPEVGLGLLKERVSDEVFHFLVRSGSKWDAALDDSMLTAPPVPGPEALADNRHWPDPHYDEGARALAMPLENTPRHVSESNDAESGATRLETMLGRVHHDFEFRVGSNNWAVGKSVGRDGHAILASDMHLGLRVPATWYRALMNTPTIDGTTRRLIGVTLPGAPVMVEGSNGSVAWGFTNSYGDYGDVIELVSVEGDPDSYMTPSGPKKIEKVTERLAYPGGFEDLVVEWSIWGPVVAVRDGRRFVHHWIGDDPNAFDLNIIEMESSTSVEQTMGIANRAGMPNQNVMIADADGNIGWTISGRIPKRKSTPPMVPVDWSKDDSDWQGYLEPENHPRVYNPAEGRLWTANSRILGQEFLNVVGDGRYDPGARARQIRDRLRAKNEFDEQGLLEIQLDDEAIFLSTWQGRLKEATSQSPRDFSKELLSAVDTKPLRASVDSVAYRIVREFRTEVVDRIFGFAGANRRDNSNTQAKRGLARKFGIDQNIAISYEDVVTELLDQKPLHWLPSEYSSWDELLTESAKATEVKLNQGQPISKATWGAKNRSAIRHPLSAAVTFLGGILDMPDVELPGDNHMPRVQSPSGGASQRLVVSPGDEENGIYHQPGGQSGNPLSPYFRAGFYDWAYGKASPLLPGPKQHELILQPK